MNFNNNPIRKIRQAVNTVWALIAVNILVFFMTRGNGVAMAHFSLIANAEYFRGYQLITYMFLHADFMHLLFNMYGLYLFGTLVAPVLGRNRFLTLYFTSGIGGGLLQLAANWTSGGGAIVGASGALFGVMMAVAMTRPNLEMIMLFFPVPIKMRTLVVIYAVLEILSNMAKFQNNIAHLAHLGGFLLAYVYMIIFCRREVVWSLKNLFSGKSSGGNKGGFKQPSPSFYNPKSSAQSSPENPEVKITGVSQKEVDRLLDKISNEGVNSLSEYERAELQFFREQMQKNSGR